MGHPDSVAVVTGPDGTVQSLGEFLRACKQASGMSVTKIVQKAGISRANFYLLEKDNQRPALTTLVGLFGAMGFPSYIPTEPDPALAPDLVVAVGEDDFHVDLQWSAAERTKSRERYISAASTGLGAALGVFGTSLGRQGGARLPMPVVGRTGAVGVVAAVAPVALPALGSALTMAARHLRERRAANQSDAATAPTQEEVFADLTKTAAAMSTEELEALLAAMKAMRPDSADSPDDNATQPGTPGAPS